MGGAITKPEYWLGALGFLVVITFALLVFGNSLQDNDNITLDNDSNEYITNYANQMRISGINDTANDELDENNVTNPITKFIGNIPVVSDALGLFALIGNALSGLWTFFAIVFSLPSFFISSFGINLAGVKFIVNVIGNILLIAGTIMLVRLGK